MTSDGDDKGLSDVEEEIIEEVIEQENWAGIVIRALNISFVMALVFLGEGFEPIIERYIIHLSPQLLYWVNMVSAVLDNATLTAAEISPIMDEAHIEAI